MPTELLPAGLVLPPPLRTDEFIFEVLGPEHNERDHPAWTRSIEHIRSTPGFAGRQWPTHVTTLSENLRDLERHREEYQRRTSFAYAVLVTGDASYVGCVYFCPPRSEEFDVDVRSWVRKERADLDQPLYVTVRAWLDRAWPWSRPDYAPRCPRG